MDIIINYFVAAIEAILNIFGKELDGDFIDNLKSMFDGLKEFGPATEKGSIDI